MWTLIETIFLIGIGGGLAFYRAPMKVWTVTLGIVLLLLTFLPGFPWAALIPLWIIYLAAAALFNIEDYRLRYLSKPILAGFRKVLPPMSDTEREALEAGDVWWEGELFRGAPNWQKLLSFPKPSLAPEEQAFIDNQVETLCAMLDDWEIVHQHADLPKEVWDYLKKERFFGLVADKKYGGHGFSALAHSCIVSKIASRSMSAAVTTMVPNSLGPAELLYHYGTEEQKEYYLPRLVKGEEIPCFALTSPEAGSDAGAMPDTGVVCKGMYKGKEIIGIKLSWSKHYITLAPIATLLGLAFKLYDPEHLLGDKENIGITLCLIPADYPGVEIGNRHMPLNLAFLNGPTRGKDVFIPLDFIIGGPAMRGKGWRMLMEALSVGRGISIPALATGGSKLSYRMTGAYARLRKQFSVPIGEFEGIVEALARIGGSTYMSEATRCLTTTGIDLGVKPSLVTAITKYHLSESSRSTVNDAMDIHAGRGIQLGPRNYLGLLFQGQPVSVTVEGANILTRNLIIFGQGAIRCHPYVRAEMEAAANTNTQESLAQFDKLLMNHIGYTISNAVKAFAYGLTGGLLIKAPVAGPLAKYYRQLTRMSTALALAADIAMAILGGQLKRKERLSARLGDVLSHLYLASAVLKFYKDQGELAEDLPFVQWCLEKSLHQIQEAFRTFFANFTPKWIGYGLAFLIFPWRYGYKMPKDKLSDKIAAAMMQPCAQRDRLTQYCYVGKNVDDSTGRIEITFQMLERVEVVQKKLAQGIRNGQIPRKALFEIQLAAAKQHALLTDAEIDLLKEYETLRLDAVKVDEFEPNTFIRKNSHAKKQSNLSA